MSAVLEGYHLSTKLIGKLTGYAAVVAAAFAIAVALIAVAPANEAKAATVTVKFKEVPANATTQTIVVSDDGHRGGGLVCDRHDRRLEHR